MAPYVDIYQGFTDLGKQIKGSIYPFISDRDSNTRWIGGAALQVSATYSGNGKTHNLIDIGFVDHPIILPAPVYNANSCYQVVSTGVSTGRTWYTDGRSQEGFIHNSDASNWNSWTTFKVTIDGKGFESRWLKNETQSMFAQKDYYDYYWSSVCGYDILVYKNGTERYEYTFPLIRCTHDDGDLQFMYNMKDDHPYVSSYSMRGISMNIGMWNDNTICCFTKMNLTTGVKEYLTPEDGNVMKSTYAIGAWKTLQTHLNTNEVLCLSINPVIPSTTNNPYGYAARLVMNFQKLN